MMKLYPLKNIILLFTVLWLAVSPRNLEAQCSSVTPTFTLDLSGSPNASSVTPTASRNGTCCGGADPCVKIVVLLNPNTMALKLTPTGADPGGALTYEFNCNGQQIPGGTPICLPNSSGSVTLTICKVGNNPNSYSVESVPKPSVPDSIFVRNGCTQTLVVTGFSVPTISWTAVNSGTNTALFNGYLSCTSGCATVVVSPNGTVPVQYVDYKVSGTGAAPCQTQSYSDTVRVYFYNNLLATLTPTTICYGSISAVLSPTVSGGKPGYTYTWTTGSNNQNITVGAGNYTVQVGDQTGCPPVSATVAVSQFTLPINANGGPDQTRCKSSPNTTLNGTITSASGGLWSGGSGTFAPATSSLNVTYIPTPAEVTAGSVQLYLTTTGNQGCPPHKDTINLTFQNPPLASAGTDFTVCANNNAVALTGVISGFTSTPLWSSSGTGSFTSLTALGSTYTPSSGDITTGSVNIVLTTTNNGSCPPAKDTVKVIITPKPVVSAGPDFTICSSAVAAFSGTVTAGATTGSWSTTGDGSFGNPSSLITTYSAGTNDINTGTVSLILTSTNNGNCLTVRDTIKLTVQKMAVVSISPAGPVCSAQASIALSGTVTGATTSGSWTTNGTGVFASPGSLVTSYAHSAADIAAGNVTFSLTTTNNAFCPAAHATVGVVIIPEAFPYAGVNQWICSSQNTVSISTATINSNLGTTAWSSGGTGTFSSLSSLATTYSLSAADYSAGTVIFTLSSLNNSVCPNKLDTVMIRISQQPTVAVIASSVVCSIQNAVALTGTVTGGTNNGLWSSGGSGAFGNNGALATSYTLSGADKLAGMVIFTLTSTNNGTCAAASATTGVTIIAEAFPYAGVNQWICSSQNTITISTATINPNLGTTAWSSNGTGTFSSLGSLSTTYALSAADYSAGAVIFTLSSVNNSVCPNKLDTVMIKISQQPTVAVISSSVVCSIQNAVALTGTVTGGTTTGSWNSNGSGTFGNNAALATSYTLSAADKLAGNVIFTLTSTNNGTCAAASATTGLTIIAEAFPYAGINQWICSSQNTVSISTATINPNLGTTAWSSGGTGTFSSVGTLNTTYSLSAADYSAGVVIFTLSSANNSVCPNKLDTVMIKISQQPSVTAASNSVVCSTQNTVALTGTVTGGTNSGIWGTNGSGAFGNLSQVNTTYTFSGNDKANGSVTFTLTTTNNGTCAPASFVITTTITPLPTPNAGFPQQVCSSAQTIALTGNSSTGTGSWTASGTGTYVPSNSMVTSYSMTPADVTAGVVNFTLTTTGSTICPAQKSTMQVAITRAPVASAGPDKSICATPGNSLVTLSGTVTGGGGSGVWSSAGSGTFTPPTSLNTSYFFSSADVQAGTAMLILTTTNNGPCAFDEDTVVVIIRVPAIANAGTYPVFCSSIESIPLNGSVIGINQGGAWSSGPVGGAFTPTHTALNASYSLTPFDISNGSVTLTLTTTNNGNCPAGQSVVTITVKKKAVVNAGADKSICSSQGTVALNGLITGVTTTGFWSTTGGGTFSPSGSQLNATYFISPSDVNSGNVLLYLTSTGNDVCSATLDTVKLSITKAPVLTMKVDTTICQKQSPFKITGSVNGGSGEMQWKTTGTGSFTPNNYSTTTSYAVSEQDVLKGSVVLSLNSLNNGPCANVSISRKVTLYPSPTASFTASSYTVFLPADPITLTNNSTGASNFKWSFGDGKPSSTLKDPSHSYDQVGYYDIVLIATNSYGCSDTANQRITVISEVRFPTAFTPNPNGSNGGAYNENDQSNDVFFPFTGGTVEYDLMIFNRWGELLFRTNDIRTGWDGYFKGKICQQDAYVWKAYMKFFDGRIYNKTGSVTLLR